MSQPIIRTTSYHQTYEETEHRFLARVDASMTAYGPDRIIGVSFVTVKEGHRFLLRAYLTTK